MDKHETPTLSEIKLTIDKSNLELEKRLTASITESLSLQNKTYLTEIINVNNKVTLLEIEVIKHAASIKGFKSLVATVASVTGVIGGLIGFFIAQLTNIGGN